MARSSSNAGPSLSGSDSSYNVRLLSFESGRGFLDFSRMGHVGRADFEDEDPMSPEVQ